MASAIFQPCWYWRNRGSPAHAGIDPNITAQIQTARGSPAHAGIDPNITAQIQTAPGFPPSRPRPGARPAPSATGSTKSRPGRELPRKGSRPPVKPASSDDNPAHGPRSLVPARNRGRSGRSLRRRTQGGDPEEGECLEMPGYRRCERQPRESCLYFLLLLNLNNPCRVHEPHLMKTVLNRFWSAEVGSPLNRNRPNRLSCIQKRHIRLSS